MAKIHNTIHINKVDTSIIWGIHDTVLPLNTVREKLSQVLPDATLYEFSASGHLPHMEEQERFHRVFFEQILNK
jgi:pimeloyl-ACP methyl ester carboxylesterase